MWDMQIVIALSLLRPEGKVQILQQRHRQRTIGAINPPKNLPIILAVTYHKCSARRRHDRIVKQG